MFLGYVLPISRERRWSRKLLKLSVRVRRYLDSRSARCPPPASLGRRVSRPAAISICRHQRRRQEAHGEVDALRLAHEHVHLPHLRDCAYLLPEIFFFFSSSFTRIKGPFFFHHVSPYLELSTYLRSTSSLQTLRRLNGFLNRALQLRVNPEGAETLEAALLRLDSAYADTNMIKICEDSARREMFGPVAADPEEHVARAPMWLVDGASWYNVRGWAENKCLCYAAETVSAAYRRYAPSLPSNSSPLPFVLFPL